MTTPNDKSLGDQNTFDGGRKEDLDAKSLGDEATFAGGVGGESKSLGDEVTYGGDSGSDDDLYDDGMEIVDLESRYTTEGVLGKGGMGEVLLATDTRLERKVAIKRILGSASRSKTAVNRFLTEAKSIAALNHPNIVQIYDYGRAEDGPFLIMEYVEGNSLLDRCGEGAIPLEEAVDLACQLCDGLGKAHAANIIHRDIKPANVLLTPDGVPKLTDFGLAKAETADTGMTMAGAVLGTLDFMPPEQRRDAALVDARSDLWALAATFYQMVTGKSPKIIKFKDVPKSLHDVLGKALEDSKDDRYQTARDLRDALKASQSASADEMELEEGDCPHCGTKNPIARKFCRSCAESLEVSCLSCSTNMPMWEDVCDSCGTKQADLLEQRRGRMASDQAEAESLLKGHDFDKARDTALALRDESDLRLRHLKSWAEGFLPQIEQGREQEHSRIGDLLDEALAHQQAHDYATGLRTLVQVPAILAGTSVGDGRPTAARLKKSLQDSLDEIKRLNQLIRDRVKKRELTGLLTEVEKLQGLQPARTDLAKLHKQLTKRDKKLVATRDSALAEARQLLKSQDYDHCLKQIARIDHSLVNEDIRLLRDQARSKLDRLQELRDTIATSVKSKQLHGLLPVVREALELESAAKDLQKLRGQLIEREQKNAAAVASILKNATSLRQQCQFDAAGAALEQISGELATEESNNLQVDCQNLGWSKNGAMDALRTGMQTEDYQRGLNLASGYRTTLAGEGLTDGSFNQSYADCQRALRAKQEAEESAQRQKAMLIRAGIGVAALLMVAIAVWAFLAIQSSMRDSALASAIQSQRWKDALALDPDNAEALVGRARSHLTGNPPDVVGAFADLTRAAEINSSAEGLQQAQGLAYSRRAREQAKIGNIAAAESDLRQAQSLGVADDEQRETKRPLAGAYAKRAEAAVAAGNTTQGIADGERASLLYPGIGLSKTLAIWTAEKHASNLVRSYEQDPSDSSLDLAVAALDALSKLDKSSTLLADLRQTVSSIRTSTAEKHASNLVRSYEQDPSDSSLDLAVAALDALSKLDKSSTLLADLRQTVSSIRTSTAEKHASNLVRSYEQDPSDSSLDLAVAALDALSKLDKSSTVLAELKVKIVSALVSQAEGHLKAGDYAQGLAGYGLLSKLDPAVAANLVRLINWESLTADDISSMPPEAFSKMPSVRNSVGMEFRLLPAGTFTMGAGTAAYQVTLTGAFSMGVHEVTQSQYAQVMGKNPSDFKGGNNPVENVSWEDAVEFCRKLSALPEEQAAGRVYRLPTEAEWEYACRAGTTTEYSFGDDGSKLGDYAWYDKNSGDTTHPVGIKKPNPWGLYDMHGNVWEWCEDWYESNPRGSVTDPTGPSSGSLRVSRGGSWRNASGDCRSAYRGGNSPGGRSSRQGFRLVSVSR